MIYCLILTIAFSSVSFFFWLLFMVEIQGSIVSPYSVSMNFDACFFASFFTNGMNVKGTKSWAGALFLVVLLVREEMPLPCPYGELKNKLLGTATILAWWFLLVWPDVLLFCMISEGMVHWHHPHNKNLWGKVCWIPQINHNSSNHYSYKFVTLTFSAWHMTLWLTGFNTVPEVELELHESPAVRFSYDDAIIWR